MKLRVLVVLLVAVVLATPVVALDEPTLQEVAVRMSQTAGREFKVEVRYDEDLNSEIDKDGNIRITSAMLETLVGNPAVGVTPEDEAAGLLGHEMVHVRAKHYRAQRRSNILGAVVGIGAALLGADEDLAGLAGGLTAGAIGGHTSRVSEYEADRQGVELAVKAGYNPNGLVSILRRLQSRYGNGSAHTPVIGLFASHPDTGVRIKRLEQEIAKISYQPVAAQSNQGSTVVVVVDPEAGYSSSYGFGRGYYYQEDFSRVAKQETEAALEKKGYQVLVSTEDVGPLQSELELENSEWGQYGENRQPIGYFSGADMVFYVSAYVKGEASYDVGNWRHQAEIGRLEVGVLLRQIDLRTRKQLQTLRGSGSSIGLNWARVEVGRGWDPLNIEVRRAENLARQVVAEAVRKALSNSSSYSAPSATVSTTATTPPPPPPPAVAFIGIGREIAIGAEPMVLRLKAPAETNKVLYGVFDAMGTLRLKCEADKVPFPVVIRLEVLRTFEPPLRLEAIVLNQEGRELGRTSVRLVPAP